ncbi:MAG TPA: transcriptional regulator, partial [Thioploca sp.]|nr:transcriptional regulator [Thioploca sp.]
MRWKKSLCYLLQLVRARDAAGFTQEEVAQHINTKTPEVAKLESAVGKSK